MGRAFFRRSHWTAELRDSMMNIEGGVGMRGIWALGLLAALMLSGCGETQTPLPTDIPEEDPDSS